MLYLSSDHAGFELKTALIKYLADHQYEYEDCGATSYNEKDDYPDFIIPCAEKVAQDVGSFGIVIGGSGQGEALAANKVKGIRAALYYGGDTNIITLSKQHNNANVLSLGARFLSISDAEKALQLWLDSKFTDEERHVRRLNIISKYEETGKLGSN